MVIKQNKMLILQNLKLNLKFQKDFDCKSLVKQKS